MNNQPLLYAVRTTQSLVVTVASWAGSQNGLRISMGNAINGQWQPAHAARVYKQSREYAARRMNQHRK